jgi:hypothetical protein
LKGYDLKPTEVENKIFELAGFWQEIELEHLYMNVDVVGKDILPYYSNWMLSARVLVKLQTFFKKLQWRKQFEDEAFKGVEEIGRYLEKEEIEFSPGK